MKKRIIATLLVVMMMLAVAMVSACGSDDPDPIPPPPVVEQQPEEDIPADPPEPPEVQFPASGPMRRGTWDDNIFESEYLGLRFAKPDGWFIATDEEIAALTGIGTEFLGDDVDIDALMELAAVTTVYDMMVSSIEGANISILYEQLLFPMTRITASEYIEVLAETLISMGMDVDLDFPGTTRIGNYDWHSFGSVMDTFGMNVYGRYFVNIHEGFARSIAIIYSDLSNSPDELLSLFFGLNDPLPPPLPEIDSDPMPENGDDPVILEPVDASALVGTWYWMGSPYYIFNDDGTGVMDVGADESEILWAIVEDAVLRICFTPDLCESLDDCMMPLEWYVEFDGDDNLTLSSVEIPGMVYHYERG